MTQNAAAGIGMPVWRAWTARLAMQRAMLKEQFSDLGGKRTLAQKRAAAAEIIAQDANAARLRALLEAARKQAAEKPIHLAERRFADARGDWEAAQQPFTPPDEDFSDGAAAAVTAQAVSEGYPVKNRPASLASPARWIAARLVMLAIVVAAAVFLYQFRDRLGGNRSVAGVPSPSNSNVPDKADVTAFVPQPGVPEKPEAIASALQSGAAETVGMAVAESTEPVADEAQAVSEVVVRPAPEEDRAVAPRRARKVPAAAPTPGPNPFRTSLAVSDGVSRPVRGPEVE